MSTWLAPWFCLIAVLVYGGYALINRDAPFVFRWAAALMAALGLVFLVSGYRLGAW